MDAVREEEVKFVVRKQRQSHEEGTVVCHFSDAPNSMSRLFSKVCGRVGSIGKKKDEKTMMKQGKVGPTHIGQSGKQMLSH